MKILYHHRTQGQGAEGVHIKGVVNALRRRGCHITMVSPPGVDPYAPKSDKTGNKAKEKPKLMAFLAQNLPQVFFELMEIFYNFYSFAKIHTSIKEDDPCCIYERYAFFNLAGVILARRYNLPLILEANSSVFMKNHSRPVKLTGLVRMCEKLIFKNADMIITISTNLKQIILENHALSENKVVVMSNAIDPERFRLTGYKKNIVREKYHIRQQIIVGFVGAFVKWHGIKFMLHALHEILQTKDIHILIVGDGPIRPEIEQVIKNLNIHEHVTITGFIDADDVPGYLSGMDICVMPDSNTHGSPVKIFEYMAMGKPVVAPVYEPITEVLTDHVNSLLFPPRDSNAFIEKIVYLIENKDIMQKIGKNAKETVFKKHTWDEHARKIIDLCHTVRKNR